MPFEELPLEEQEAVAAYSRNTRAFIGQIWTLRETAVKLNAVYGNVQGILAELDGNEIIPDGNGLAGALPIDKNELITLTAHYQVLLTQYGDGHFPLWAKASGFDEG